MAVYRLDPFQNIVGVSWGAQTSTEPPYTGPWWRITKNEYRSDLDVDYVGQGDGVGAVSSSSKDHKSFVSGGEETLYHSLTEARAAVDEMAVDEFAVSIYRLTDFDPPTATTEPIHPLDIPLSDSLWVYVEGRNGHLSYSWKLGRDLDAVTPDPNCPPADYFVLGDWASEEHALNYREYSLTLSSSGNSWTLNFDGDDLYCIPG